ncbi:trithorax group protein osa-like [Micropterus salmoides]|uniref:trithorax group protein osa-like n=1 Tax=Micropterus salmoides TaxID=27706 RepID=UPI0018EAE110|nr:trithorax group protein osa-like [Micropterus salmoides]
MACGGSKILLCLGLVLFASSFCHCATLSKLKALDTLSGNLILSQGKVETSDLRHGRLVIGDNSLQGPGATKNLLGVDADYQADMGWVDGFSRLKPVNSALEQLLKMEPKVECTGDFMKLQVQDVASTTGSLFFVERGSHLSPLPLSKLPPSCGYTIRSTLRELVLVAPYDGCFVALEEDSYVLPLHWRGVPVRMSCPLMKQSNPPTVACYAEGMVVKTEWIVSVAEIKVNLTGTWEPLMKASPRCGFSVVVHPEGVVISVRYAPCMERQDGMYTLKLAGEGETKISCPSASPAESEPTSSAPESMPKTPAQNPPIPVSLQDPVVTTKKPSLGPEDIKPPPKPVAPQGQVHYPYPFYPQLQPENPPTIPKPPPTQGQVHYPYPFYPQLQPENPPTIPKPPPTQGQVQQPFYPFYPHPEPGNQPAKKPSAVPKPPPIQAPQGQMQQPFYPYPFYPHPEPGNQPAKKPSAVPKPPPIQAPQGQMQQPFYPYPFYPHPEPGNQPAKKPSAVPKPPPIQAPQGQMQQPFYPYPFYPQLQPENRPTVSQPPATVTVPQVPSPLYPLQSKIPGAGTNCGKAPTENQVQIKRPPVIKPLEGQVHPSFNPYYYYYYYPQQPQPVTLPPATTMQQMRQVTTPAKVQYPTESYTPQPTNGGIVPPDFPRVCPQSCPSGYSNCCPQIAFHQYLYPVIPAGHGSKDALPVYSGLPSPHSVGNFGFNNGLGSLPPQKPTEATTTQAADSHHNWPYLLQNEALQNLPQSQSPAHYVPSNAWAPGNEPVNPVGQYDIQPPKQQNKQLLAGDMKNPSGFNFMSFNGQDLQQDQNKPPAKEPQPSNEKSSDSKGPARPEVQGEPENLLVPYYMLQDAQAPTYNKSVVPNNSPQSFVSDSQKSTKNEQTVRSHSEPKSYVLLRHSPPGREPNSFSDSPLPSWVHDANILAQNSARPQSNKHQYPHIKASQENSQHPKWLGKGMSNPLADHINYKPGDKSQSFPLFYSTPDSPQFVPLSQDPSPSVAHLRPKFPESFQNFWKPKTPLDSNQRILPHGPGNMFQQWNSAADHQANGPNQPLQREGGKQK